MTGSNGCTKIDSVYVGVASFPIITAGNDTTICEGQSVILDAQSSEMVAYKWSHGPTVKTTTVSPTTKTSYKVRGTNATGCYSEDSLTISVKPLAKADFTTNVSGKNVTLTNNSTNNNNVFWDLGDGKTSSNTSLIHTYAADGTYKIKLIVGNDCGKDSLEKTVIINTAGINDALHIGIQIYPQPVKNQLTIVFPSQLNGQWDIVLFDATGKTIKSITANPSCKEDNRFCENSFSAFNNALDFLSSLISRISLKTYSFSSTLIFSKEKRALILSPFFF